MNITLEIFKIGLPAVVVAATCVFTLFYFLKNEREKMSQQIKLESLKSNVALKLQAYERIILFLERITPRSAVLRFNLQNINALQLQKELIGAIRQEFDHNITQQIYVSNEAWNLVKAAKESVIQGIIKTAAECDADSSASEFGQLLLGSEAGNPAQVAAAILFIKKEVQELF